MTERAADVSKSDRHPHEPMYPPVMDPEGRCLLCGLTASLSWALDLLDMYDKLLIELGEPREMVYSSIHLAGKKHARVTLSRVAQ